MALHKLYSPGDCNSCCACNPLLQREKKREERESRLGPPTISAAAVRSTLLFLCTPSWQYNIQELILTRANRCSGVGMPSLLQTCSQRVPEQCYCCMLRGRFALESLILRSQSQCLLPLMLVRRSERNPPAEGKAQVEHQNRSIGCNWYLSVHKLHSAFFFLTGRQ